MTQLPDLAITALRANYNSGSLTPVALINSIYDRIESEPLHPVWITVTPRAEALAQASPLTSPQLPLYGIPFAIKDNIDFAGLPTTAACPAFAYTPQKSAFVVDRLQQAGAILIGKTNLDQFATGLVGVRSPHGACSSVFDRKYISGGSSSGSAVAVASGLVTFSLGTDTAGSGRVPAAFNNIVGLKPSRGLLSTSGVVPACRSLDCVSIFALSCADANLIFEVAKAADVEDPFSRVSPPVSKTPPAAWRIGVPRSDQLEFLGNQEYDRLYSKTLADLRQEGHSLVEIDLTPFSAAAQLLYAGPYVAERFAAVGSFVKTHTDSVDPTVAAIVSASERWTAAEAYQASYRLKTLTQETLQIWKMIDVLLLPTAPTTYTIEEVRHDPVTLNSNLGYYTNFVNLLDLCGVAVPAGFTSTGLPFGVTAIGPTFSEAALLGFAHGIQQSQAPIAGRHISNVADTPPPSAAALAGWISLGVVGAHLSGQPLNYQLVERGAKLLRTTTTAPDYKFYALTNTKPAKPGLIRVPGFVGPGIEIEVWTIHESQFGSFVAAVPPPLSIGTCTLADGSSVKGFLCEPYAVASMPEITQLGRWRSYLKTLE
jgi:allophanate hydrolase